ncbi:MAG TPA: metallophosphoesterase [Candidatus Brocadiia bacterium]|nr:metallophosphoesterase [Candidatus Brocadiia bacterium]
MAVRIRERIMGFAFVLLLMIAVGSVAAAQDSVSKGGRTVGNKAPFAPFTFVQAGDPQMGFGASIEKDRDNFIRAGKKAKELGAAFVLVCGDLVHNRTPQEFEALDAALKTFETPVLLVPGNHDLTNMADLKTYREKRGEDYYRFTFNNCEFIALNTMTLLHVPEGVTGPEWPAEQEKQWAWLEATLAEAKKQGRDHIFIFTHFPPFGTAEDEKETYFNFPMPKRQKFLKLVRENGVEFILTGHSHRTTEYRSPDGKFSIRTVAGTAKVFDLTPMGVRRFNVTGRDEVKQEFVPLDKGR